MIELDAIRKRMEEWDDEMNSEGCYDVDVERYHDLETLIAEVERLQQFTNHDRLCPKSGGGGGRCTCGLDESQI